MRFHPHGYWQNAGIIFFSGVIFFGFRPRTEAMKRMSRRDVVPQVPLSRVTLTTACMDVDLGRHKG